MHFGRFINSRVFGEALESRANRFLRSRGLKLLCRNYRSRYGEIDLIMVDSGTLVFVEVRYRRNEKFGGAIDSVTTAKQKKIRLTAAHYLQSHPQLQVSNCRFDVIGLSQTNASADPVAGLHVDWIKNAFY